MESTLSTAPRQCCFIIPPHMLSAVASSQAASEHSRRIAAKTLIHAEAVHHAREGDQARLAAGLRHPRPHGFVPGHVLQAILDSEAVSEESKQRAGLLVAEQTGDVEKSPATSPADLSRMRLFRIIFDSRQTDSVKGPILLQDGIKPSAKPDTFAQQVYDNFESTFKFYSEILQRNSIDDNGMSLLGCVHYDDDSNLTPGYDNAFWDGIEMCFGDGDPEIFNTFTESLDITGHELTHGVTEKTANLPYWFQSGALNESMSDVFGSMIKQYNLNQKAKDADWLIGEGLFRNPDGARALRDMANPGTAYKNNKIIGSDPQPKDMDGFVITRQDQGGVHINSGIANRAFHLAATSLGEFSWDVAGKIWYQSLLDSDLAAAAQESWDDRAFPNTAFNKGAFRIFANITLKHAKQVGGDEVMAVVQNAWETVKVL